MFDWTNQLFISPVNPWFNLSQPNKNYLHDRQDETATGDATANQSIVGTSSKPLPAAAAAWRRRDAWRRRGAARSGRPVAGQGGCARRLNRDVLGGRLPSLLAWRIVEAGATRTCHILLLLSWLSFPLAKHSCRTCLCCLEPATCTVPPYSARDTFPVTKLVFLHSLRLYNNAPPIHLLEVCP